MVTVSHKKAHLIAFIATFLTSIAFVLNLLFTYRLRAIYGGLPWELIMRPVLEALVITFYAVKFWNNRRQELHSQQRWSLQLPSQWRYVQIFIQAVVVLFWFGLECRVAVALTRPVGEIPFATSQVATFSCNDTRWSMLCPARNGTMVFGTIGAFLAITETYVCYKLGSSEMAESIRLSDSIETPQEGEDRVRTNTIKFVTRSPQPPPPVSPRETSNG
ncbi:hypothetical protein BGW42_007813 [Actinomortierella wolfii]|nr:hypothetical protein BGW42_007813 [Actinomortierella wolfii]